MNPKAISAEQLNVWLNDQSSELFLVDVREEEELEIASFPSKVLNLPLSKSSCWMDDLSKKLPNDRPIVVICHRGVRSWDFGKWLLQQPFGYEVWNLNGGIDAWSMDIDSRVPRY